MLQDSGVYIKSLRYSRDSFQKPAAIFVGILCMFLLGQKKNPYVLSFSVGSWTHEGKRFHCKYSPLCHHPCRPTGLYPHPCPKGHSAAERSETKSSKFLRLKGNFSGVGLEPQTIEGCKVRAELFIHFIAQGQEHLMHETLAP